jgi:hypothetical protein
MLQAGRSKFRFPMSLNFSIDLIFQPHYGPGVESQKWVPEIFLGGKGRPALKADNVTAICEPIV